MYLVVKWKVSRIRGSSISPLSPPLPAAGSAASLPLPPVGGPVCLPLQSEALQHFQSKSQCGEAPASQGSCLNTLPHILLYLDTEIISDSFFQLPAVRFPGSSSDPTLTDPSGLNAFLSGVLGPPHSAAPLGGLSEMTLTGQAETHGRDRNVHVVTMFQAPPTAFQIQQLYFESEVQLKTYRCINQKESSFKQQAQEWVVTNSFLETGIPAPSDSFWITRSVRH